MAASVSLFPPPFLRAPLLRFLRSSEQPPRPSRYPRSNSSWSGRTFPPDLCLRSSFFSSFFIPLPRTRSSEARGFAVFVLVPMRDFFLYTRSEFLLFTRTGRGFFLSIHNISSLFVLILGPPPHPTPPPPHFRPSFFQTDLIQAFDKPGFALSSSSSKCPPHHPSPSRSNPRPSLSFFCWSLSGSHSRLTSQQIPADVCLYRTLKQGRICFSVCLRRFSPQWRPLRKKSSFSLSGSPINDHVGDPSKADEDSYQDSLTSILCDFVPPSPGVILLTSSPFFPPLDYRRESTTSATFFFFLNAAIEDSLFIVTVSFP